MATASNGVKHLDRVAWVRVQGRCVCMCMCVVCRSGQSMEIGGEVGREIEIAAATTFMTNLMLNCARKEGGRKRKKE